MRTWEKLIEARAGGTLL